MRSPSASVQAFQVSWTKNDRYLRMSPASTESMSAATAVAQLGGEVGQVLADARLERGGLGAHGLGRALQHLLAGVQPLLRARDPILQLGHGQLERAAVNRQALADERRQPGRVRQRVVEQQPPALVRDRGAERADERVQPGAGAIAGERLLRRHREDRRLGHDRREVLAREARASRPARRRRAGRPSRPRRSADPASSAGCAPPGTAAPTRSGSASRRAGTPPRRRAAGSRR